MRTEMQNYRPTWAEIDLDAIRYNFGQVKRIVGEKVKILVAVKANGYGHGLIEVSRSLQSAGVDYLGVATVDEAILLRDNRIMTPILVFGSILPYEIEAVVRYNLTQTICTQDIARGIDRCAKDRSLIAKVHIEIDTGMGRMGVWHREAIEFVRGLSRLKNIELEGIYTHFPSADEEDISFTHSQIRDFRRLVRGLEKIGIDIPYRHAANSMGVIGFKESHLNLVRPGLMIYGIYPRGDLSENLSLKPALNLKTRIVYLKKTPSGRTISYGRTYITKKDVSIATLPIGYGDGFSRFLSNKAEVLVRGRRAPVVGIICMDQTMIEVGDIEGVKVGDEVILIGGQGRDKITAEELARLCGTIPYEIVCWIGSRVPRVYRNT